MPGVVLLKGIQSGLLLLLLSHFSCVRLRATPWTAAHQAPLSLGFSRQEYRNGLPFPSPMHACMLSRFSCVQLCVTLWTAAHQAPLSMGFSRQEYWSGLPLPYPLPMASNALSVAWASSATARAPETTPGCCEEHVPDCPQTGWLPSGEGPGLRGRPHCRLWQRGLATRGRAPKE